MVEPTQHKLHDKESTEAWLKSQGIDFQTCDHDPVMTIAEMKEKVVFTGEYEKAQLVKNLFLADGKNKTRMWLICASHDTAIDMKALTKKFGCANGKLRGGAADVMEKYLGVKAGAVSLFSILNDEEQKVNLVIDEKLKQFDLVAFHPMVNIHTTAFSTEHIKKISELSGHNMEVMDFSQLGGGASEETKKEPAKPKQQKEPKDPKEPQQKKQKGKDKKEKEGHVMGIEYKKEDNFSEWYRQVITKSELIEYYDISGCYILRPNSYYIWEQIQNFIDTRIKKIGVQNVYFPMFVSEAALKKEEKHLEGFSPEVAWVTKSGQSELAEPIAIRPTSETIMYPAFAKWINSHRDLPLMINQWTNIVRWEFKHPTPFIRTREFLWQEGHTAHATKEDMQQFALQILDIYAGCYEDLLAVPVIKGRKSEDETFAGADRTTTVELYVPVSGRGIQGGTSHMLGQNFSKMFDVTFLDTDNKKQQVWQTSWGYSTRSIGSMIMIHSDNQGLVLPPKVAITQIVIIPIISKGDDIKALVDQADALAQSLRQSGLRVYVDDTDTHNPGYKFNMWELKGTPVRIELGKKDFDKQEVRVAVRQSGQKFQEKWEGLAECMNNLMEKIQNDMFAKAKQSRQEHLSNVNNWQQFMAALDKRDIVLAPWCDRVACEENVKNKSKEESEAAMEETKDEVEAKLTGSAKTLCVPFELGKQDFSQEEEKCFACEEKATCTALWGRSY